MKRILCPVHEESTPSMVLYENVGKCFGCGAVVSLADLGQAGVDKYTKPAPKEDLAASIARIKALPTKLIRGLELPYDETGYYIVWPENKYYKKRLLGTEESSKKYYCPRGHAQPLLSQVGDSDRVIFVEGEINALSLFAQNMDFPSTSIHSPGGAGSFNEKLLKYVTAATREVLIMVDADKAGVIAYITLATLIKNAYPDIILSKLLMTEDANEILVKYGKEELKAKVEAAFNR